MDTEKHEEQPDHYNNGYADGLTFAVRIVQMEAGALADCGDKLREELGGMGNDVQAEMIRDLYECGLVLTKLASVLRERAQVMESLAEEYSGND